MNQALWEWCPRWEPWAWNDAFNFRHGPDADSQTDLESCDLVDVIIDHWERNNVRPSSGE